MSARVLNNIARFRPDVEVYSIDDCFIRLTGFDDLEKYGRVIRNAVIQNTGIPVSIGLAPSKTPAKFAKKTAGVYLLDTPDTITAALENFPLSSDYWYNPSVRSATGFIQ
jgi:DNA polymerase V